MTIPNHSDPARLATPLGLLALAAPMAASMGAGFFVHYANRTVLSWHSQEALAAGLPAGMLAWTLQSFFVISCGYLGSFAAQHHAAGEEREAGAYAWPMFALAAFGTVLSLALIPLRHVFASIYATDPVVAAGLAELLGWYFAEIGPSAVAAGLAGFCGGIGRTGLVLAVSALTAGLCIALNCWLVLGGFGLRPLGISGAGIATLATGICSMLMWLAWFFARAQRQRFGSLAGFNLDPQRLLRFLAAAVPKGGTEVLEMISFVAFTAAIAHLGTSALAASNLAFSTYLMAIVPVIGFNQGLGIACGQAVGAGRPDLARQAVRSAMLLLGPYLLAVSAAFVLIPGILLAPARAHDDALWAAQLALATPALACLAVAFPAEGMQFLYRFAVQGAGDTRWPLVVLVALSVVFLAIPAWLILPRIDDGRSGLIAGYGLFATYLWIVVVVMAWRFYCGPWARMSLRAG